MQTSAKASILIVFEMQNASASYLIIIIEVSFISLMEFVADNLNLDVGESLSSRMIIAYSSFHCPDLCEGKALLQPVLP